MVTGVQAAWIVAEEKPYLLNPRLCCSAVCKVSSCFCTLCKAAYCAGGHCSTEGRDWAKRKYVPVRTKKVHSEALPAMLRPKCKAHCSPASLSVHTKAPAGRIVGWQMCAGILMQPSSSDQSIACSARIDRCLTLTVKADERAQSHNTGVQWRPACCFATAIESAALACSSYLHCIAAMPGHW